MCTTCKRLFFPLLQLITFVCTTAIENILSTTPIVNFWKDYCNHCKKHHIITVISKCTMVFDNFLSTIAIGYFCMHYCNWQLLFGLLQLRTNSCCRLALTTSVTLIATTHIDLYQHYSIWQTCYELTLWLLELLLQLEIQNMSKECSNIINYNNSNNIYRLTTP